ncbi:MAG: FG-GAP repeat protein, partial [Alphaproteobacteria bacterium]|nr:FG-GAP repeat protein [Alphaproteobacteria bacterium]
MAADDRAGPALAYDQSSGLTHMAWNQNGQIYTALWDPICKEWEQAAAIPGSAGGTNLQLSTGVAIHGPNGTTTPGVVATWTVGTGNQAQVVASVGVTSPLGGYQWSRPFQLTQDNLENDDAQVSVTKDGQIYLSTTKTDANDPQGLSNLYSQTLTIHQSDLVFGGDPSSSDSGSDFVQGANLPAITTPPAAANGANVPPGVWLANYNFDLGLRYSSDKLPIIGTQLPAVGGKPVKIEIDLRLRGGYQEQDPSLPGFSGYDTAGLLRAEVKVNIKLYDLVTIAGYLQGLLVFGGPLVGTSVPQTFLGGRLTVGAQGKLEYPLLNFMTPGPDGTKTGAAAGLVFDVRLHQNNVWTPPLATDPNATVPDFAKLVRADGSPAMVGDNPSQLHWEIDPTKLAGLILGPLGLTADTSSTDTGSTDTGSTDTAATGAASTDTAATNTASTDTAATDTAVTGAASTGTSLFQPLSYQSQIQLSPGLGVFGKVVFNKFLDAKMSLIIYADFFKIGEDPFGFKNLRARLDAEGRIAFITFRYRQEWSFNALTGDTESSVISYASASYAPVVGGGTMLSPGTVFANQTAQTGPTQTGATQTGQASDTQTTLATAPDGTMYMAWVQDAPNNSGDLSYIVVSQSTDGGQTWSAPTIVPGSRGYNADPVISFDASGRPVVAWNNADPSLLTSHPAGLAYVILGSKTLATQGTINLGSLGTAGFTITGGTKLSAIGAAVSSAGDLNGDKVPDFAVAAPSSNMNDGAVYVVFGAAGLGSGGTVDVSKLDGKNGFVLQGAPNSDGQLGASVASLGDFAATGFNDLAVGAPGTASGAGAVYVVVGHAMDAQGYFVPAASGGVINVAQPPSGTSIITLATGPNGVGTKGDGVGTVVAGGTNFDGDGTSDVVVGAPGVNGGAGAYYVVYGKSGLGASGPVDLTALDGTNGFTITYSAQSPAGQPTTVPLGTSATFARLNSSTKGGPTDLVVASAGQVFVVSGLAPGQSSLDLFNPGGASVLTIDDRTNDGFAPLTVSDAGDLLGNGYDDLIIGVPAGTQDGAPRTARSYVVFGGPNLPTSGTLDLSTLNGTNGFQILGAGDSVSAAGDVNGDGYGDLLIGNPTATVSGNSMAGQSYILFGSPTLGASGTIDVTAPGAPVLAINGASTDNATGASGAAIGNVNGDPGGLGDVIIGAPQSVNQSDLDQTISKSLLNYSTLTGGTWTNAAQIAGAPAGAKGQASLQTLPDGSLLLIWLATDPSGSDNERLYAAFWNGNGWGTPQLITTAPVSIAQTPHVAQVGGQTTIVWTQTALDPNDPTNLNNASYALWTSSYSSSKGTWSTPQAADIEESAVPSQVLTGDALTIPTGPTGSDSASIVTVADAVVSEGSGTATVKVSRTGDLSQALSVHYATEDDTATAGSGYVSQSGDLTFAAGQSQASINIQLLNTQSQNSSQSQPLSEDFHVEVTTNAPTAYLSADGLRMSDPPQLQATVTVMANEPTQLAAINSGFVLKTDPTASVGQAVLGVGDIQGKGFASFALGAPGANSGMGAVYLVYGSKNIATDANNLNLATLNGQNGVILNGSIAGGQAGTALAAAKFDGVNTEIAIGAPQNPADSTSPPGN